MFYFIVWIGTRLELCPDRGGGSLFQLILALFLEAVLKQNFENLIDLFGFFPSGRLGSIIVPILYPDRGITSAPQSKESRKSPSIQRRSFKINFINNVIEAECNQARV